MSKGQMYAISNRIKSSTNIENITKAMNLTSSSRFNSLQLKFNNSKLYQKKLENVVSKLNLKFDNHKKNLYIIIGSDIGLCSSYNNNIIKFYKSICDENDATIIIGKKIHKHFKGSYLYNSSEDISVLTNLVYNHVEKILKQDYNFNIIYTDYIHLKYEIKIEKLNSNLKSSCEDYEDLVMEPNREEISSKMLPLYIKFKIYRSIISSYLSENFSRMVSMKSANTNAKDLIKNLKCYYNKERQSIITQEILEVVSSTL